MKRNRFEQSGRDFYDRFIAGHDDSNMGECEICGNISELIDGEIITDKKDGSKHFICDNCMEEE